MCMPRAMPMPLQGVPLRLAWPPATQMAAKQQPVNKEALERMPPQQKQQLVERLHVFARTFHLHPEFVRNLTGMILGLPNWGR